MFDVLFWYLRISSIFGDEKKKKKELLLKNVNKINQGFGLNQISVLCIYMAKLLQIRNRTLQSCKFSRMNLTGY